MELNVEALVSNSPIEVSISSGLPLQWVLALTLLAIVVLNSVYKMHFSRAGKLMKKVRGPPNLPLIGVTYFAAMLDFNADFIQAIKKIKERYGPVFGGFVGTRPFVYLTTVKQATVLLKSNELDKSPEYFVFRNMIGDGLFLSNGTKWVHRRKMIMPSAGMTVLREFTKSFNSQSNILIDILGTEVADSGRPSDIEPHINRCFLDISFECFIGRDVNAQKERYNEFVTAINGVFETNCDRLLKPWMKSNLVWKLTGNEKIEKRFLNVIKAFLEKIIKEERSRSKHNLNEGVNEESRRLLMDVLLEKLEAGELTEQDLHDELLTIVTAARDTSTRTIIVTLFLLALHPEHQKIVQKEVEDLFGDDLEIRLEDASQLKYLECCIKESLRLLSVVPFFARVLKEEMDIGDGIILPKGTTCHILPGMVHRDPEVFQDPDTFRPQRFLEDKEMSDPYAFLGFSAGRRNCPGQKFAMLSVKTIMSHLMKNFDISTNQTMEDVKFTVDLIQKPVHPIQFQFKRRT